MRLGVWLAAALSASAVFASPESLPPGHWAYAELEHFESRGFVRLDGTRPYSRLQVRHWVEDLQAVDAARLGRVERQRLARLVDEFVDGDSLASARFDPPVVSLSESDWRFAGDLELASGGSARSGASDPGTGWGDARFDMTLNYRDWLAYDTRYRAHLAEESGLRTGKNRLSSRERNWRGLTSDNDRGYVALERGPLRLSLGRDYLAWGAQRGDEMLVSDAGLSLDALQMRLHLGRFELSSAAGLLSTSLDRNYAAHRLEARVGPVRLGVAEAVVYTSPHFEPAYLFPIGFYYGNQFNERGDDNVLLGADLQWATPWGIVDGDLLVDDFIYDGDPAPQKIGWRLGGRRAVGVAGSDFDLRASYTRMNRWTFTHRNASGAYVAGSGDPSAGDPFLGNPLGPDADRWTWEVAWVPRAAWRTWLLQERTRRGDGNRDLSAWVPGTPYQLPFPSGDVQSELRSEIGAQLRVLRGVDARAAASLATGSAGRHLGLLAELRLDL